MTQVCLQTAIISRPFKYRCYSFKRTHVSPPKYQRVVKIITHKALGVHPHQILGSAHTEIPLTEQVLVELIHSLFEKILS